MPKKRPAQLTISNHLSAAVDARTRNAYGLFADSNEQRWTSAFICIALVVHACAAVCVRALRAQ